MRYIYRKVFANEVYSSKVKFNLNVEFKDRIL